MDVLDTVLDAVGDTPLVRLDKIARSVEPTVLAKLEMLNPGGSVKDRIGLRMIDVRLFEREPAGLSLLVVTADAVLVEKVPVR